MTSIPVRALLVTMVKRCLLMAYCPRKAEVVVVEDKKQYSRAQVKRRLNDSPQRQAPRCPHFGMRGGCQQACQR
jgi:tRNA/tmRNA/rRNA uracil-C5-methylase (TrmA/RlmC/RlmD family)